ncbi:hypothetical protein F5Y18DRAFT_441130 [Xylariaceae sp. FL1019]|nr:hypothetical protein F5Y18DRAFT_441130 [Xylariaceae sp. FL1019]
MSAEKTPCVRQHDLAPSEAAEPAREGDLLGRTAIVTGANSGIGFECARQLFGRGLSKLILAVRDEKKGVATAETIASGHESWAKAVEVWHLDYCTYDSIISFAARTKSLENLDIVVLNAGVYRLSRRILPTGHEEGLQVNYLSTALLAMLLLPVLKSKTRSETQPGRLTFVSTSIAAWSKFRSRDACPILASLDEEVPGKRFDHHQHYCTTKLLAQLFLVELTQRVPSSVAIVNSTNPGLCYGSRLSRDGVSTIDFNYKPGKAGEDGTLHGFIAGLIFRVFGQPCAVGARALVDATVQHGAEVHGQYLVNGKTAQFAPVIYTPEGRLMAHYLWQETMNEFQAIGIETLVQDLSHGNG